MKIGCTASRKGIAAHQLSALQALVPIIPNVWGHEVTEAHHGDCVGGDETFHDTMRTLLPMVKIHIHPPKRDEYRAFCVGDICYAPAPYIKRNHNIVNVVDALIAMPEGPEKSFPRSGTWATVRYAIKSGVNVHIIDP